VIDSSSPWVASITCFRGFCEILKRRFNGEAFYAIQGIVVSLLTRSRHMDLRPIKTERDHRRALAEIERLWLAAPGTADHDRLEALGFLVSAYEERRWPVAID
jgi:hypothetical protein